MVAAHEKDDLKLVVTSPFLHIYKTASLPLIITKNATMD